MFTLNDALNLFVIMILSYIVGSIPTSIIAGKLLKGIDIRDYGSGNAGGTNSFRVLGWKAGVAVSSIDIFKGFASAFWISKIALFNSNIDMAGFVSILAGAAAVVGHCYTIFAGFKGGKGVATAGGMLIAVTPIGFLMCLITFAVVLLTTGYVSLSSISAAVMLPTTLFVVKFFFLYYVSIPVLVLGILACLFIIYSHRSNIKRLLSGTERNIYKKNKKSV